MFQLYVESMLCLPGAVHSAMIANLLCESVLCLPGVVHSAMIACILCESMKVCICLGKQLSESVLLYLNTWHSPFSFDCKSTCKKVIQLPGVVSPAVTVKKNRKGRKTDGSKMFNAGVVQNNSWIMHKFSLSLSLPRTHKQAYTYTHKQTNKQANSTSPWYTLNNAVKLATVAKTSPKCTHDSYCIRIIICINFISHPYTYIHTFFHSTIDTFPKSSN